MSLSLKSISDIVRLGANLPIGLSQFHRLLFDQLGFFAHKSDSSTPVREICGGGQMGLLYKPVSADPLKSAAWLYAEYDPTVRISKPNPDGTGDIEGPRILLAKGFVAKKNKPTPLLELIAVGVVTNVTLSEGTVQAVEYVKGAAVTPQMKVGAALDESVMTSKVQNFVQQSPQDFIYSASGLQK